MEKYIEDIKKDAQNLFNSKEQYSSWINKSKKLLGIEEELEKVNDYILTSINELNEIIKNLSEEDSKLINSRIKGISMISKMNINAIKNGIDRIITIKELNIDEIIIEEINEIEEVDFESILNENYNKISKVEDEKKKLINNYFECIEVYILPIVDGIISGINYSKCSNNEIIKNNILSIYEKLINDYDKILLDLNITRLTVNVKEKVDLNIVDVIDIEEIDNEGLDETIESIIRDPFEYNEDIYNQGHNYVVRKGQIIVYKYKV